MHLLPTKSLLQTDIWASFKEAHGWHAHKVGDVLVLERPLPMAKSLLYTPELRAEPEILLTLLPEVYKIAQRRGSIFYRLELLVDKNEPMAEEWLAALSYTKFLKAFEELQPEHRQIVPLDTSDEKILEQMKQKGRYNVRLAEKEGVMVRESTPRTLEADVAIFYDLFAQTGKRDKFSIRPKSYFDELCRLLYEHSLGKLFVATYDNQPVAAAIITLYDHFASYLYGASGNLHRDKMGPYALHWAAMQWAATLPGQEAKAYDLLAIRPPGDKPHPYDGITRFKEQFGGERVDLLGSWDLPFNRSWYTLFSAAEKMRRK